MMRDAQQEQAIALIDGAATRLKFVHGDGPEDDRAIQECCAMLFDAQVKLAASGSPQPEEQKVLAIARRYWPKDSMADDEPAEWFVAALTRLKLERDEQHSIACDHAGDALHWKLRAQKAEAALASQPEGWQPIARAALLEICQRIEAPISDDTETHRELSRERAARLQAVYAIAETALMALPPSPTDMPDRQQPT